MFTDQNWLMDSRTNARYLLDCTPARHKDKQWFVRVTVYRNEAEKTSVHTALAKAIVFDTPNEAAELGRICGERWIAEHQTH